jgi:uncharacterized protein with FMN-binding domain
MRSPWVISQPLSVAIVAWVVDAMTPFVAVVRVSPRPPARRARRATARAPLTRSARDGKGVADTTAQHPALFVTLTAPVRRSHSSV